MIEKFDLLKEYVHDCVFTHKEEYLQKRKMVLVKIWYLIQEEIFQPQVTSLIYSQLIGDPNEELSEVIKGSMAISRETDAIEFGINVIITITIVFAEWKTIPNNASSDGFENSKYLKTKLAENLGNQNEERTRKVVKFLHKEGISSAFMSNKHFTRKYWFLVWNWYCYYRYLAFLLCLWTWHYRNNLELQLCPWVKIKTYFEHSPSSPGKSRKKIISF